MKVIILDYLSPIAHVSGSLIVTQPDILGALGQDHLEVLRLGLDKVHEVVQVASGGLGGVGEVRLLHCDQESCWKQPVTKYEFTSGNINLLKICSDTDSTATNHIQPTLMTGMRSLQPLPRTYSVESMSGSTVTSLMLPSSSSFPP